LQKALQTRDAASVAAAEALQEASAAESVLRSLRQETGLGFFFNILQLNLPNNPISPQAQIISF
jgi:hypothetical protein